MCYQTVPQSFFPEAMRLTNPLYAPPLLLLPLLWTSCCIFIHFSVFSYRHFTLLLELELNCHFLHMKAHFRMVITDPCTALVVLLMASTHCVILSVADGGRPS